MLDLAVIFQRHISLRNLQYDSIIFFFTQTIENMIDHKIFALQKIMSCSSTLHQSKIALADGI